MTDEDPSSEISSSPHHQSNDAEDEGDLYHVQALYELGWWILHELNHILNESDDTSLDLPLDFSQAVETMQEILNVKIRRLSLSVDAYRRHQNKLMEANAKLEHLLDDQTEHIDHLEVSQRYIDVDPSFFRKVEKELEDARQQINKLRSTVTQLSNEKAILEKVAQERMSDTMSNTNALQAVGKVVGIKKHDKAVQASMSRLPVSHFFGQISGVKRAAERERERRKIVGNSALSKLAKESQAK